MTKGHSVRRRAALLFTVLASIGAIAAYLVTNASADGRTLDALFCSGLCIQVTSQNGQASGTMGTDENRVLTLRPGTYWLTVTDNSNFHNFQLRSCAGMAILCDPSSGGNVQELTPICNDPLTTAGSCPRTNPAANVIQKTVKVNLSHGTYRLYCAAGTRKLMGMYVDLVVGGVGQIDDGS